MGGAHAPIDATARLLSADDPSAAARSILASGGRVPGWGNSFVRGEPDPAWKRAEDALRSVSPEMGDRLDRVTETMASAGTSLYPNPSAYTAAAGLVLGIPRHLIGWLFVQGRLAAWAQIAAAALR
jgi:citrate synthase